MSLPTGTGASIQWLGDSGSSPPSSGPAQTTGSSTSATSSNSGSGSHDASTSVPSITSSANATSAFASPSPTPDQSTVLSTGSKVGIGFGAGVGGLVLLVSLALLVRWLYGKKEKQRAQEEEKGESTAAEHGSQQGNGELRSPAWSGHKSELPGSEMAPSPRRADFGSKSEFEGSPAVGSVGRPISGGYEMPGKPGTMYEMPG
jgi:hypothetical protein